MPNWSGEVCLTRLYINFVFLWGDFVLGMSSVLLDLPFIISKSPVNPKVPCCPQQLLNCDLLTCSQSKSASLMPHCLEALSVRSTSRVRLLPLRNSVFSVAPLPHSWTWTETILSVSHAHQWEIQLLDSVDPKKHWLQNSDGLKRRTGHLKRVQSSSMLNSGDSKCCELG